ncbi:glycosyltransferase family 4 protein [Candidatus Pacearchaeota archaeon]|nr:glycosyltransferase family 4 protein [Candidatus Pacearchaeota archaeon]
MKKLKILELTNYTSGGCGVGARALQESIVLKKKGHIVRIFSSYFTKGSNDIAKVEEFIEGVRISRFPAKKLGGESFMSWNFELEALKFKPNIIIVHAYRHLHTLRAIKIARKLNAKIFLVTHAPFDRDSTRTFFQRKLVFFYDNLIGKRTLKKFDKIIAITKWEIPFLLKLEVSKEKIEYIPNGIREEFFSSRKINKLEKNKVLYMGRVSSIKNLGIVIKAFSIIEDKNIKFEIIGPCENNYLKKLISLIKVLNLEKRIKIINKTYNYKEEITELDSTPFFILPSLSEGMPQVLVEAMALGKVVIASNNRGNSDIIINGKNGFLFKNNNFKDLADKINKILKMKREKLIKVKKEAKKTAKQFSWNIIIDKILRVIK